MDCFSQGPYLNFKYGHLGAMYASRRHSWRGRALAPLPGWGGALGLEGLGVSVVAWLVQLEADHLGRKHKKLALSVECCFAVVV